MSAPLAIDLYCGLGAVMSAWEEFSGARPQRELWPPRDDAIEPRSDLKPEVQASADGEPTTDK